MNLYFRRPKTDNPNAICWVVAPGADPAGALAGVWAVEVLDPVTPDTVDWTDPGPVLGFAADTMPPDLSRLLVAWRVLTSFPREVVSSWTFCFHAHLAVAQLLGHGPDGVNQGGDHRIGLHHHLRRMSIKSNNLRRVDASLHPQGKLE